jgi:hypothetical protein
MISIGIDVHKKKCTATLKRDWDYHELMKGHDVMITAPKELVRLLETLEGK